MSTTTAPAPNRARVNSTVAGMPAPSRNEHVIERNGVVFKRAVSVTADPTHVPKEIIPPGHVYQWNTVSIWNQEQNSNINSNRQFGWSPVPAERHDGMFMPMGHKGTIIIGGQQLEERPIEWEQQARMKAQQEAKAQINDSRRLFKMDPTDPTAFSTTTPGAMNASYIRQSNEVETLPRANSNEIPIEN